MAPRRRAMDGAGDKCKARQSGADTPEPTEAQRPDQAHRLVDVDPWAVLLEQLMEVPEEEPAERKDDKTGQGRGSVSPRSR